jgi:uncharacterized protein
MMGVKPVLPADPTAPLIHRFRSRIGEHALVIPYTRIFDLAGGADLVSLDAAIEFLVEPADGEVPLDAIAEPPPQSISLNVSSSCNLACGYCYAARGNFAGAQAGPMDWLTARAAIDRLLDSADPNAPITIGFLGGEPFVNRRLIHRAVAHATSTAIRRGLDVRFSVTTNGTLLDSDDVILLQTHPFAVTVSLDGPAGIHDQQRPRYGVGSGSWADATAGIAALLAAPGKAKIAARATITRHNLDITTTLETLADLGFPEIGFAPLRVGPTGSGVLQEHDWPKYLGALIAASQGELARLMRGLPIRLTNLAVALKQLHRGAASPYPCGAGGGYFSVSAAGRWYACHRAIGDTAYELGSSAGINPVRRRDFVQRRHVHAQQECRSCWARYLCSGGCHQEASARSEASCDFIRGWLSFCLAAYCEIGALSLVAPGGPIPAAEEVNQ